MLAGSVIWDPWKKEYVLYTRNWIRTSPKYRTVRRLACKDLSVSTLADCWQDQEIVMAPDAIDSSPPGQHTYLYIYIYRALLLRRKKE